MRKCSSCGKEIAKSARACPYCGGCVWHPIEIKVTIFLIAFNIGLFWWVSSMFEKIG